jgi:hypothetical protein
MKPLNKNQKTGIWLGIALAVAMGLCPPWLEGTSGAPGRYAPIFNPPRSEQGAAPMQIDFSRLVLQWAMVGMVVGGIIVTGLESTAARPQQPETQINSQPQGPRSPVTITPPAIMTQAETAELRRLRFPEHESIGQVLVESGDDPDYWDLVGDACGVVGVPANCRVQLELRKDRPVSLGSLGQPEMSSIVSIDASGSKIHDDDLMWVAALTELRELDLSHTEISDGALQHISRVQNLEKLWLDHTNVTDEALVSLKSLPHLRKVSFTETKVSDAQIISLKDQAKDCIFVLSNGKNA